MATTQTISGAGAGSALRFGALGGYGYDAEGGDETLGVGDEVFFRLIARTVVEEGAAIDDAMPSGECSGGSCSVECNTFLDSARIADSVHVKLRVLVEDGATVHDGQLGAASDVVNDAARVGDEVALERPIFVARDAARAGDAAFMLNVRARQLVQDGARVRDGTRQGIKALVTDGLHILDGEAQGTAITLSDVLHARDSVHTTRQTHLHVSDAARVGDGAFFIWRALAEDGVTASDEASSRARVRATAEDMAAVQGEALHTVRARSLVVSSARAHDAALHLGLHARTIVTDGVVVQDEPLQWGNYGQAWTANTGNWAMSRWLVTMQHLAVIDGVLVGCNASGVHAFDGEGDEGQPIAALVQTARIDMTGRVLGHPDEAHLEYTLRGRLVAEVVQTQTGEAKRYSYPLLARPLADDLTNARAKFGRGLRGRHFAYGLRVEGTRLHINDWTVLIVPSKRSV